MRTGEREHRRDRRTGIVRAALAALLVASAAAAQQDGPQVSVTLDPDGAVTVGTPIEVTATVLVPTYMPKPPVWPELQIADAITRLPERATQPLTRRIGTASWSGLSRTWEIIPQRAADYDLGAPEVAIAYADPDTGKPVESRLAMPDIAFSATVPPGATGMDPFLPASALKLSATLDGLPKNPRPGDAFTLTLTAAAVGPPAILLPPLGAGIATPVGLRAYPEEPALTDVPGDRGGPPTATRTEQVTYVIEAPGDFTLPGLSLDWWNTAKGQRETAATAPVPVTVAAPAGGPAHAAGPGALRLALLLAATALAAGLATCVAARRRGRPPTPARLSRELRRAIRHGTAADIRGRAADWLAALSDPPAALPEAIEAPLRELERPAYGVNGAASSEDAARRALLAAVAAAEPSVRPRREPLPPLNPSRD